MAYYATANGHAGLSSFVGLDIVQKPLRILAPLVVDVFHPAVQRDATVGVLFYQATDVIDDRPVRQTHSDVLSVGQPNYRSLMHFAKHTMMRQARLWVQSRYH
jgi:hypothetical protein